MVEIVKVKRETNKINRIITTKKVSEQEAKDLILFSSDNFIFFLIRENGVLLNGEKYLNKVSPHSCDFSRELGDAKK